MCFSATANFVGSGVLGGLGAITLSNVKHRREVTHNMSEAYMLYARGLLPFLLPLGVLLFEPAGPSRRRMLPFVVLGGLINLYALWALAAYPLEVYVRGNSIVFINKVTNKKVIALTENC